MTPSAALLALSTAAWVNVPLPLPLDLGGRVALLEFSNDWGAAGQRVERGAQRLQTFFPQVVLVSVRTPGPGEPAGLGALTRQALRREIMHPMLEDAHGSVAAAAGVEPPALVVLGPDGSVAARFQASDSFEAMAKAVAAAVARSDASLSTTPLAAALERDDFTDSPLAFPTQLAYDASRGWLFICDTGHNRVVVADSSGRVRSVIGNGAAAYRDGASSAASLDHPQGVAVNGDDLWIADSGNDAVRTVNLKTRRVATLINDPDRLPWPQGLFADGATLFIAAPLAHALFAAEPSRRGRYRFAGDGRDSSTDGLPPLARFRSPAALARLGPVLYIADPEAGALRAIDLSTPSVTTPALSGPGAPLKRPMALAALGGALLIADAGDGALKSLDPASGRLTVLANGLSRLSGVAASGREIFVAETDRSQVVRYSLDGRRLGPLRLRGLNPLPAGPPMPFLPERLDETLPPAAVRAGQGAEIELSVELPPGFRLNGRTPLHYRIAETFGVIQFEPATRKAFLIPPPTQPQRLKFVAQPGQQGAVLDVDFYYCRDSGKGLCRGASKRYRLPIDASNDAPQRRIAVVARP